MRQSHEAISFFVERGKDFWIGCDHIVTQCLEVTLQVGQRRPQLVGRVDDELTPHALLFLQARGHLVKGIGERDHLARSLSRDTCVIVAMSDTPGGSPDLFQRPRKMTCQYNGEPQAEDHPQ